MWWVQSLFMLSPHHAMARQLIAVWFCACVRNESSLGFFSIFFPCEYWAGNRPALSWPSRRQESSLILLTGQHISQPPEAHGPSPPLRSPSAAEWRTKESQVVLGAGDADMETHAHPSTNTLTNVPLNRSFLSLSALNLQNDWQSPQWSLSLSPGEELDFHVHACNVLCLSAVACMKLWPILQQLEE